MTLNSSRPAALAIAGWLLIAMVSSQVFGQATPNARETPAAAAPAAEEEVTQAGPTDADFIAAAPERLSAYLQVDTVNPPGNEVRGVEFFAKYLDAAGIEYKTAESAPGRGNIWARLKGGRKPGLVLLNHIDVVPADERYWEVPALSGLRRDGYIWGRGALDMKGTAIAQFQAFLALANSGAKLNRDVVFMATADEEAGGSFGAGYLAREHRKEFDNIGFLLNEGGYMTRLDGDTLLLVEVTQKVPLWLRLTATDRPGHGSSPTRTTAVTRILRAGARLADTRFPARAVPAVAQMFAGLAPYQADQALQVAFADVATAVKDDLFLRKLEAANPGQHALLRNTCSLTRLEGSGKINVIPPQATLEMDCRMLPDTDEATFIEEIRVIVNDPNIQIEKIMSLKPAVSPTSGELFDLLGEIAAERDGGAKIIPSVSTGFTDSHFFRDMGIKSYGFGLFLVPQEDIRGVHGNNERLSEENILGATASMLDLLQRFTGVAKD